MYSPPRRERTRLSRLLSTRLPGRHRLIAAAIAAHVCIVFLPHYAAAQGQQEQPLSLPLHIPQLPAFNSIIPIPTLCEEEIKSQSMETGMDPASWRLLQARRKQAYEACMKQKRQLELQEEQERAAQWRYYGNVKISWKSWKKTPGSSIRTGKGISRCWFDVENPGVITGSPFDYVEFQWARCPSDWDETEAVVAVDCQNMRTRISLRTWDGAWSTWRVPAERSPEERLVLDLCRNAVQL